MADDGMKQVDMFTDGACKGNPGPGGWAAILSYQEHERKVVGYDFETTNNRMELQAVIEGLKALKEPCKVTIYTDSELIAKCGQGLWKRKKNVDLWMEYNVAVQGHQVSYELVKGHSGHEYNERADRLASDQADIAAFKLSEQSDSE